MTSETPPPVPVVSPASSGEAAATPAEPAAAEHPRAHPRYEVEAYVDYTGSEVVLYHRVQNLSLGGVCIQSDTVEDVGTTIDLVINFPELDTSVSVRGEVVWSNREHPMDMGVRFVDLDPERKETLRRFLATVRG
jgi:uncharacterized protein (TIGR02266 family)